MADQPKKQNALQKLEQDIAKAPNLRGVMMLAQDRFVKSYQLVTGRKQQDAEQKFQSELLNYLDIINEKPDLKKADKFSHFAAIMKAATTGLSFASDGHLYPVLYGNVVKTQIGAHGKKEMLRMMDGIDFINEAVVVMKGDIFVRDKLRNTILKHESTDKSSTRNHIDDVIGAYVRLEWKDGRIIDVYVSQEELLKAKSKSKNKGPNSVWEEWPLEMCKKVTYHRAKKAHYRLPTGVFDFGGEAPNTEDGDTTDVGYTETESFLTPETTPETPVAEPESVTTEVVETEVVTDIPKKEPAKQSKPTKEVKSFLD